MLDVLNEYEKDLVDIYKDVDEVCLYNSNKVLESFKLNKLSEVHFNTTTGYGYSDIGRDKIESIYATIFKSQSALVRSQLISGTHALTVALFGILRPNDTMLCVSGTPYDTLHEVIGLKKNNSSLMSFGINYEQIDLVNNDFDYDMIIERLKKSSVKLLYVQRSKGYSTRKSITIDKLEKLIDCVKKIDNSIIIMIDNCYCEFVNKKEPIEIGANVCVGSLIKNLGGCIARSGAYIVGDSDLINLISERLTVPGEGKEIGPSMNMNREILMGLFNAPNVVRSALKTAILTSYTLEKLGYEVEPKYNDIRADIVQNIIFNNSEDLIKYCQGIQEGSPVDSFSIPTPWDMPGYSDKVIMAAGTFTNGSSIELSCDGPIRKPYIAYQQGSFTYEYGKLGLSYAIDRLKKNV